MAGSYFRVLCLSGTLAAEKLDYGLKNFFFKSESAQTPPSFSDPSTFRLTPSLEQEGVDGIYSILSRRVAGYTVGPSIQLHSLLSFSSSSLEVSRGTMGGKPWLGHSIGPLGRYYLFNKPNEIYTTVP